MTAALFDESVMAPREVPEDDEQAERYTPDDIIALVKSFAPISIDPFTTPDNRTGAAEFCYRGGPQCGMRADWAGACARHGGIVWFQPPYSRGKILEATKACVREAKRGAEIIGLVTLDLSTEWGALVFDHADALGFWKGRIEFVRPGERFEAGFPKPSLLTYFGDRSKRFARVFADVAHVLTRPVWG
jgi:DNA N-6-adenine-methyltransferase (Dam)